MNNIEDMKNGIKRRKIVPVYQSGYYENMESERKEWEEISSKLTDEEKREKYPRLFSIIDEAGGISNFVKKLVKQRDEHLGEMERTKWLFDEERFIVREKFASLSKEEQEEFIKECNRKRIEENKVQKKEEKKPSPPPPVTEESFDVNVGVEGLFQWIFERDDYYKKESG